MSKLAFILVAAFVSGEAVHGSTLLNENFNELTAQLAVTSAGAFTTTGGTNVDIVGPANGFGALCAAPASGNCIDLDGSGGNSQGILQSASITLNPGVNYFLSYDLIGSGRGNTTSATVNFGPYLKTFTLAPGDTSSGIVTDALVTVSSATTTNLIFSSNTPGNVGTILDNVLVTSSTSSATPEPSTMSLFIPALLGLSLLVRRQLSSRTE